MVDGIRDTTMALVEDGALLGSSSLIWVIPAKAVPRWSAGSRSVLETLLMLLSHQPPIVGALGNTQVSEHPTLGQR